ncbi:cytochrome P450 2J2-like protein [Camelus ferus]|nr:cytochrome P450 2J2-like protein [Camelus ferus]
MWWQQRRFCLATLRGLGLGKRALELQLQEVAAELAEAFHREQGRPFDPQVPIVRSTARVIGALVFGRRFLLEDPFLKDMIQAIDFGLAFVSTIWHRAASAQQNDTHSIKTFAVVHHGSVGRGKRQLYDMLPWAFRRLPGPHQEMFRYQEAVRGYLCQEINRHKLSASEAPKAFISCYLAQITKSTSCQNTLKQQAFGVFFPVFSQARAGSCGHVSGTQALLRGLMREEFLSHKPRPDFMETPGLCRGELQKALLSLHPPSTLQTKDDPVSTFSEDNLIQVVIDLFLGGTDTTATTLRWALFYMVQHRAIQGKGPGSHLAGCPMPISPEAPATINVFGL